MWLSELLQKLIPRMAGEGEVRKLLDLDALQAIRVELFKQCKLAPEQIVRRDQGGLIDRLCKLRLELDRLLAAELPSAIARDAEVVGAELDRVIGTDLAFADTAALESSLASLSKNLRADDAQTRRRRARARDLALIATLLPVIGYGIHWSIANFFSEALLEEVNFVYPEDGFEYRDDRYALRPALVRDALQAFGPYYFGRAVFPVTNPLPLAWDASMVEKWGVGLDPKSELASAIEAGAIGESQLTDQNLVMFRVFVRNIREHNIVSRLRIEAQRIGDNDFPWRQVDVETEVEFSIREEDGLTLSLHTTRAPIVDTTITATLDAGNGERIEHQARFDLVKEYRSMRPDFAQRLMAYQPDQLAMLYISPQKTADFSLDPARRFEPDRLLEELRQAPDPLDSLRTRGYVYADCADGGIAIISGGAHLTDRLAPRGAQAVDIRYRFELLDGTPRSGEHRLPLAANTRLLEPGVEAEPYRAADCFGDAGFALLDLIQGALPAAAIGGNDWINLLDKFALALMDNTARAAPAIAVERQLVIDFSRAERAAVLADDAIHVLKDGDYVLFKILAFNFAGGDYRFRFYFDEEPVGDVDINLLWPQSLSFSDADIGYFREVPGE